jgi:four helix bundle protein
MATTKLVMLRQGTLVRPPHRSPATMDFLPCFAFPAHTVIGGGDMSNPHRYGYRRIEAYRIAHALAVRIDAMTLTLPPKERFEEAQQIRKSSKSVPAQIAEGYALRKYKDEFLHYLHRALGSADETREHLRILRETGSLEDRALYTSLASECDKLTAKLGAFIRGVERNHTTPYYLARETKNKTGNARGPAGKPPSSKTHEAKLKGPGSDQGQSRIENRKSRIVTGLKS